MQGFVTIVGAVSRKLNLHLITNQILVTMQAHNKDNAPGGLKTPDAQEIAILCARIADGKKAEDIIIFDVRKLSSIADYFVICSGFNKRQLQSIAGEIEQKLQILGIRLMGREGYADAFWILMDYGDAVIHLFDKEKRHFYDLELLWGDAPRLPWKTGA